MVFANWYRCEGCDSGKVPLDHTSFFCTVRCLKRHMRRKGETPDEIDLILPCGCLHWKNGDLNAVQVCCAASLKMTAEEIESHKLEIMAHLAARRVRRQCQFCGKDVPESHRVRFCSSQCLENHHVGKLPASVRVPNARVVRAKCGCAILIVPSAFGAAKVCIPSCIITLTSGADAVAQHCHELYHSVTL